MLGFHEPACIFFWLFSWYMSTFLFDTDSRTSFKKSTRPAGNQSMRPQEYGEWFTVFHLRWWFVLAAFVLSITCMVELEGMNTDSLMIWLLMLLRVKEVMYGHAKTMMEMCRVISWPKVCGTDHWHHEDSASKTFVVCLSYSGCNIYILLCGLWFWVGSSVLISGCLFTGFGSLGLMTSVLVWYPTSFLVIFFSCLLLYFLLPSLFICILCTPAVE